MNITPEELAQMTDHELDELRRRVMNARDQRVHRERTQAQRRDERVRAANVVREEIRAYLQADGDPAQLHALLDRVVKQLRGAESPAAGSAGAEGTSTPAPEDEAAGGGAGG